MPTPEQALEALSVENERLGLTYDDVLPPEPLKIEFEFRDNSTGRYSAVDHQDAWDLVQLVDPTGSEILSAWRDGEPWFGLCANMQECVA